eukprot:SAG22_NODE_1129_length_5458_cov_33.388692_6_plen_278_part_00
MAKSLPGWMTFCSYNLPAEPQLLHAVVSKKVAAKIHVFLEGAAAATAAGSAGAATEASAPAAGAAGSGAAAAGGSSPQPPAAAATAAEPWTCPFQADSIDAADQTWLDRHAVSVSCAGQVVRVAARAQPGGTPAVVQLYPLRLDPKGRGSGDVAQPVPWPNLYFLVCPKLVQAVGALEEAGWIQQFEARLEADEALMDALVAEHAAFAAERWALLTRKDQQYAVERGYDTTLRETGVCGLRYKRKIKCLHAQYAYHLARPGGTVVGRWIAEELLLSL